jgi:hypothetical protein
MENNSYQMIKEFIYKKLQDIDGVLPKDKIISEVKNTRNLILTVGLDIFAQILSVNSVSNLTDSDWERMQRELETHFNVAMDPGILVQGKEQQKRDNTWWSGKEKQLNDNYYWSRYRDYLKKSLPPEVIKTINDDTDIVMDNIEDPSVDSFSRYGMVVGHVQSGKTANYSALVCKAADAGYKFIVVIAGGINNLRNQTQERLNEAFVGADKGIPVGVGKLGGTRNELLPISLTTAEQDFNKNDANRSSQGLNFDNINSPIILVIKKNSNTLRNVITWLKAQYKNQIANHAMLLIDDESDYASINTREEDDPTIINKRLRQLLSLFRKSAYVAYTATPYANIFIDHEAGHDDVGKDLFPKDFIYALDAPDNYFGARKIFLDTERKHIIKIEDYAEDIPANHKKDFPLPSLPESLYEAVRLFLLNVAIRNLRGQTNKHNSMLIHATRFTMVHQKISLHIDTYVSSIKKDLHAFGNMPKAIQHSKLIREIKDTFSARYSDLEFNWNKVLESLTDYIDTIIIREVHAKTKIPLEYRQDVVTNAIVIGGTSLSRGFTLEGLSVSYFLRNTIFYDTLMQMGRWFGYRIGYEDLCHIYMTQTMADNFKLIIEATEDLIDDLKRMSEANMTPYDFGLSVKHHPDSGLQVTARNKTKSSTDIYFEMILDGHLKETSWLPRDEKKNKKNLVAIRKVITYLESNHKKYENPTGNSLLWRDVEKEVVQNFLQSFQVYSSDPFGLKSRMPIDFIKEYVSKVDTLWDIALYSGDEAPFIEGDVQVNKESRQVKVYDQYYEILNRQVSSGPAEAIALPATVRKKLGSNRKNIRAAMEKPLLMLHVISDETYNETRELPAFGISFPGGVESENKLVKLKINSVYIQELYQAIEEEESDD